MSISFVTCDSIVLEHVYWKVTLMAKQPHAADADKPRR
jgi:hypothetical protein